MEKRVRVRFAPSPTGPLHIGGVRTALYNYLFAKKHGGDFILRIEDTDQTRYVEGAEQYIIDSLIWAGIEPNEGLSTGDKGPYKQSERKDIYKKYVQRLLDEGKAYYAFDTADELNTARENTPNWKYDHSSRMSMRNSLSLSKEQVEELLSNDAAHTVRLKIDPNETVIVNDIIRGKVVVNTNELDDKIIFKSDGLPTYHLANVVDDHLMEISHVIRGEEWLPSAPLHVLLYEALGWEAPDFAHLPLILKPDGPGKLSKRDGDRLGFPVFPLDWKDPKSGELSIGYREQGYLSAAFINILAFLGWNPGTEQEIFSLEELVEAFSLERVTKAGAKFDPDKAKWFNEQHLKVLPDQNIAEQLQEFLSDNSVDCKKLDLIKIAAMMKERVTFVKDIPTQAPYLFAAPNSYDEKTVKKKWKENSADIVNQLITIFSDVDTFKANPLEETFKSAVENMEVGFGQAMIGLRLTLTGKGGGPSLFEIMELLGKKEAISRIAQGVDRIELLKQTA